MRRILVGAVAASALLALCGPAGASGSVPYTDPNAKGHLAFCDAHGRLITSGLLNDAPFAAKVVSDYVPPAPYDASKSGAYVIVALPMKGVDPAGWSTEQLTASSLWTDRKHPSAEVTYGDITLKQAATDYPPQWDGFLQLRMNFKAPNYPSYVFRYATADIQFTPGHWRQVNPVAISCTSGSATSVARKLAPNSVLSPTPSGRPATGPTHPASSSASPSPVPSNAGGSSSPDVAASTSKHAGSGSRLRWLLGALGALAVVGFWGLRRRRLNTS